MVFGSRGRTPRTAVGWGGGSSGHEPGKSCCQFREKQSEDRFSEEIQWAEWLMYCWERGIQERETKIWETRFFFPHVKAEDKVKSIHPIPEIFFFSALRNIYRSPFFRYIPFQVSKVLVFWEAFLCHKKKQKRNSSFCWSPCDLTRRLPLELGSNNGDQLISW